MRETSKLSIDASGTGVAVPVTAAGVHALAISGIGVLLLIPGCGPPI
jgi:hypothetical protein